MARSVSLSPISSTRIPDRASIPDHDCAQIAFGEVTALGVVPSPDDPLIAVGGDGKLALIPLVAGEVGRPGGRRMSGFGWRRSPGTAVRLWAAGPDRGAAVDDYDWERLRGGGFAALDPADGKTVMSGPLAR